MHLARLTAFHVRIPLKQTVRHASYVRDANDTLLICCELTDGTTGWGEGLPRPYVTGETIDTAWDFLQQTDFAKQLIDPLDSIPAVIEFTDRFPLPPTSSFDPQPSTVRDCFGNTVRCALEISLLDAACRTEGIPLSAVTSLLPESASIRQSLASVRYSGVITAMSPFRVLRSAIKQKVYGFQQCKIKVGVESGDDIALLRRVRRVLGSRVDLRIDANEAWSCSTLPEQLAPLKQFGITSVEQPVPHAEVAGLTNVRKQIGVPVMLDESLCSLSDGRRAIDEGLCDLFNIRLSKCGGFVNSLRLAAMARAAGLGYQLGCQVGETGILSAAGRHFATSVGGIRYLEGSYDRHLVAERLTVEDITFGYGGRARALTDPGLGVTVDITAVERCTLRKCLLWER